MSDNFKQWADRVEELWPAIDKACDDLTKSMRVPIEGLEEFHIGPEVAADLLRFTREELVLRLAAAPDGARSEIEEVRRTTIDELTKVRLARADGLLAQAADSLRRRPWWSGLLDRFKNVISR